MWIYFCSFVLNPTIQENNLLMISDKKNISFYRD